MEMSLATWADAAPRHAASNMTVLVVEDDPHLNDLLKVILASEGYRPIGARDGLAAVGLAKKIRPALITLDLALPKLDGQDVLDQLAADERTSDIPVVVVSACAENLRRTRQVKKVMGKPFELDELVVAVGLAIGHS